MPGIGSDASPEPSIDEPPPRGRTQGSLFSNVSASLGEKLVASPRCREHLLEQYRKLAATLHHAQIGSRHQDRDGRQRRAGEGKTLTATNLALTLRSRTSGRCC